MAAQQGFGLLFAMFNNTTFSNVKARQAVLYALDYAKICDTGMAGLATPATCFVQDGHPAYKKAKTSTPRTRPRPSRSCRRPASRPSTAVHGPRLVLGCQARYP